MLILSAFILNLLSISIINSKQTYYLPGVAPHNYRQYESV